MARPARNAAKPVITPKTVIQDERPIEKQLSRSTQEGNNTIPIRTIVYVEVGEMPPPEVRQVCKAILQGFNNGHPHYVIPVRDGKLTTEIEFEAEFLQTVNKLCEIKDNQIVMRDVKDVDIIRKKL